MEGSPGTTQGLEATLAQLRRHGVEGNFDRMEESWLQAMEDSAQAGSHLGKFIDGAERFLDDEKKQDRLGALLELLLSCVTEESAARQVLRLYWLLVYCLPHKQEYRAAFCERFEQLYPLASAERAFYEACAPAASTDPAAALRRLDRLLKFQEGAYVYHRSGWGVGRVTAVDPFLKQVKVDLEAKRHHRIAIDVIDSILEPLDPEGFHALRFEGGEELRRLRDEDPGRLIQLVLDAFGSSMPLKDIKAQLVPGIIPAEGWARWWSKTKGQLRATQRYRVGDRAPHLVERLQQAVSYEDELLDQYGRVDWKQARQIARQVGRKTSSRAWESIREDLIRVSKESEPVSALQAALVLERAEPRDELPVLREIYARLEAGELIRALEDLPAVDDQRRAAEGLPVGRPEDWQAIVVQLFGSRKEVLCETALSILEHRDPSKLGQLVRDVIQSPRSAPEVFCSLLSMYVSSTGVKGSERPALAPLREKSARELLVLILDLLEHLQHLGARHGRGVLKTRTGKILDVLRSRDCRVFRQGLEAMGPEELREIHNRLVRNDSLPPHAKGELLDVLTAYEPSLADRAKAAPWEDEGSIYSTREGLARRQEEFRELMEVKLPKNFEDVGRAASFGDLSENAEYTAALEERDQLTKRASVMKEELDRAKLIDPERLRPGVVGLGSRIRLRNVHTGEEISYSVLGPWDGNPAGGILSYRSPLGLTFLGRRVGEVVEAQLPGGSFTYEILDAVSSFESESPAEPSPESP